MTTFLEDLHDKHYGVSAHGDVLISGDKLEKVLYKAGLLNDDDLDDSTVLYDVAADNGFYLIGDIFAMNYYDMEYGMSFDIRKYLD